MNWRKRLLRKSRLYIILDKDTCGTLDILKLAAKIKNRGADVIQLREKSSHKKDILKDAQRLKYLLAGSSCLFIVNDHIDIAKLVGADGLHLGQEDLPIKYARMILGRDRIIGVSCHNLRQALSAQRQGADYIGVGPIFPTPTKPGCAPIGIGALKEIGKRINLPIFAIGGIGRDNLKEVLSCAINGVAVCREVCYSKKPIEAVKELRKIIDDTDRGC